MTNSVISLPKLEDVNMIVLRRGKVYAKNLLAPRKYQFNLKNYYFMNLFCKLEVQVQHAGEPFVIRIVNYFLLSMSLKLILQSTFQKYTYL